MSERDYLAKEEALRRLSEPEGDHELHAALERMRESTPTCGMRSTACTSLTTPTLPSSRSGGRLPRTARSRYGRPTTTVQWASWRCRSSRTARARRQAPLLLRLPLVFLGGPGHLRRAMPRR